MDFTELYRKISPRIKRIALHYRNRCAFLDADDLYQEMCRYLWEHYRDGSREGLSDYYIARGCEFHILNYLRTHREKAQLSRLEGPINENNDMLKDVLPSASEPIDRIADKNITVETIMNNGFTKREKEVFSLLLEGYTTREAGERLGVSHVMIVKAKKSLLKKWHRKEKGLPRV